MWSVVHLPFALMRHAHVGDLLLGDGREGLEQLNTV